MFEIYFLWKISETCLVEKKLEHFSTSHCFQIFDRYEILLKNFNPYDAQNCEHV